MANTESSSLSPPSLSSLADSPGLTSPRPFQKIRNVTNLRLASEEDLWEEHRDLIETFLMTGKGVKSGEVELMSDPTWQKTSLMDLNVELVNRMLAHCNFCRWNCHVDRSDQRVGAGVAKTKKHGICH